MERATNLRVKEAVVAQGWWKGELLPVSLFFVLGLLSRIPFQSRILYEHWDSVNYALATQTFDLRIDQPHPPGYILYVLLGRAVNVITGDPQTSFVWLSVLFSGLSASAMFLLGSRLFNHRVGVLAAAFLLSSPLFWFLGEVAMPHVLDAFFVISIALLLHEVEQGRTGFLLPAAFSLGMVTGLRQQTALFLLPLAFYSFRSVGLKRLALAVFCFALVAILWLVPLFWLSGGMSEYFQITNTFTSRYRYFDAVILLLQGDGSALLRNIGRLSRYTAYGWSLAAVPFAAYMLRSPGKSLRSLGGKRGNFLLFWLAPALVFYLFVHMGQQGLIFVFLPVLLLLSAVALSRLVTGQKLYWAAIGITVLNGFLFVLAPEYPLGEEKVRLLNRSSMIRQDTHYEELVRLVRGNFSPKDTVLMGADWRHVEYYLPEYQVIRLPMPNLEGLDSNGGGGSATAESLEAALLAVQGRVANVVLFDRKLPVVRGTSFEDMKGREGTVLYYLRQTGV